MTASYTIIFHLTGFLDLFQKSFNLFAVMLHSVILFWISVMLSFLSVMIAPKYTDFLVRLIRLPALNLTFAVSLFIVKFSHLS